MTGRKKIAAAVAAVAVAAGGAGTYLSTTGGTNALTGTIVHTCNVKTDKIGTGNGCWNCDQKVDLDRVTVKVTSNAFSMDAVSLKGGCTGRIKFLRCETKSADCIKSTATDLTIDGGRGTSTGIYPGQHLDCWQDLGSTHLHISNFIFNCTHATNAQVYISYNKQAVTPRYPNDVTCDHCQVRPNPLAYHSVTIDISTDSGLMNSLVCPGRSKSLQYLVSTKATNPLDTNNVKPWPSGIQGCA